MLIENSWTTYDKVGNDKGREERNVTRTVEKGTKINSDTLYYILLVL
jgi:hypothetical protein